MVGQGRGAIGGLGDRLEILLALLVRQVGLSQAGNPRTRHTVIRLLKSWAMPPVSSPRACSFCDWNERGSRFLEFFLRLLPLRDVSSDLCETDMLPVFVEDRIENDACPEQRAVLPDAPGFALVLSFAKRGLKRELRLAASAIVLGVETGEVLADDLIGRIALDRSRRPSSSWLPALRCRACRWRSRAHPERAAESAARSRTARVPAPAWQ